MYTLNELLKKVVDIDCSDLHLSVGTPPRVRKNGQLTPIGGEKLSPDNLKNILKEHLNSDRLDKLNKGIEIDFSISLSGLSRFRVNFYMQRGNIVAALLALILQRWLVKLCFIRANLLVPFILAAMIVGASFTRLSFGDIIVFVLAGTLGYVFKHADWPRVPLIMGLIMGRIAEPYLFSTMDRYGYEWLYTRPIVAVLIIFIFLVLAAPYWRKWRRQNRLQVHGGKG